MIVYLISDGDIKEPDWSHVVSHLGSPPFRRGHVGASDIATFTELWPEAPLLLHCHWVTTLLASSATARPCVYTGMAAIAQGALKIGTDDVKVREFVRSTEFMTSLDHSYQKSCSRGLLSMWI
jgi:hypothetical protein